MDDILKLETLNGDKINSIYFRINVFKEDLESKKLFLVRTSPYQDGKIINALHVDYQKHGVASSHYILIEKVDHSS